MRKISFALAILFAFVALNSTAKADKPGKDKGEVIEYKNEFWEKIKKSCEEYAKEEEEPRKVFRMDYSGYDLPQSTEEFERIWHNDPVAQGWSGMCWNYCAASFLESEANRIYGKKFKFSELYTTYWEYVEKAKRFIEKRGDSYFAQGSQADAVTKIWEKYGCVPAEEYTGLDEGQEFHYHSEMFKEMKNYLNFIEENDFWNKDVALETIKSILNHHIGEPPKEIAVDGETMTPKEYCNRVVKLDMSDYVNFISLKKDKFYDKVVYDVPDNWRRWDQYHNIPVEDFISAIKEVVEDGYTIAIGGDVSESGYSSHNEVAMVPSYDIPAEYIDDNARQFRFSNKTTKDDHGIHIVGYKEADDGKYWFLIKDSGSGSRNGKNEGYYFYHEDYIKLKMLSFMIHKSAVEDLLEKFKEN